jgi:ABC-type transport system involved in cytochrome c biogenesis permease subunit
LFITVLLQGAWFILRSYERGACPIQTPYEAYQLFAWIAALTYLFVRRRWAHIYMPGLVVSLVALAAMLCVAASNSLTPAPAPPAPAMRSPWHVWHLGAAFFAYGVLAASFAVELSYVGARIVNAAHLFRSETQPLIDDPLFHKDAHRLALFGFPVLTLGILAGAVWTANAWGNLWSWSYLSMASPLTWLLFGLYLHAMHLRRWRGVAASVFNILGFLSVVLVFSGGKFLAALVGLSGLYPPG